jgi:hypothetical protein
MRTESKQGVLELIRYLVLDPFKFLRDSASKKDGPAQQDPPNPTKIRIRTITPVNCARHA